MPQELLPQKGFTLFEAVIAIGIFMILILGIATVLIISIQSNAVIWEQLATQNDGRQAIQEIVDDLRRAEPSSIGSYPLATVEDNEIIFYANIDSDTARERIRYFIDNEQLVKGVIEPSGSPLSYATSTETVRVIADSVKNISQGIPLFEYYTEEYNSSSTPMSNPVPITSVRLIRTQLELEKDPTQTPVPLHVEATVHIRNLKAN